MQPNTNNNTKLNILGQCAVFILSPLIIPSALCSLMLLLSIFDTEMLKVFSVPLVFSMVLGTIPAVIIGLFSAFIRQFLKFKNTKINLCIWLVISIGLSMIITAKFMSEISLYFVGSACIMGFISAVISCAVILVLEHFRNEIFLSRFYNQDILGE